MARDASGGIIHACLADITKWEDGPDGTLYVYGRATTPEVDTDEQIVDSRWSGAELKRWLAEAPALRVQHNGQRDPAGSGIRVDIDRDGDGAHWIKAAVDEPVAQRLVRQGHLRAFSVGISKAVIERDVTGKARGGVVKGGRIVEVSLVDSPANRSCFLEIAKAAGRDGHAVFTGKVHGGGMLVKAKTKVMCPSCGAKQNIEHSHCPECGSRLPASALQVTRKGARARVSGKRKKIKNGKKIVGMCLGCGHPLRRKDARCKGCGRMSPLFAGKASRPYLVKSAKVTPISAARWRCWGGHVNKRRAKFCTSCGVSAGATPAEYQLALAKAADPMARHPQYAEWLAENDPGRREFLGRTIFGETARRNPAAMADFVAKANGQPSIDALFMAESDPVQAQYLWRLGHPWLYPEGGQIS